MIKVYPATFVFLTLTLLGTLFVLSSSNWLGIWLGFEMNILGFIPIIFLSSPQSSESVVNYLLVQASGSGIFLLGGLFNWFITNSISIPISSVNLLIIISVLLKIGVFPFYFWVPSVINGISWTSCLILLSWQKVAPLSILSHLNTTTNNTHIVVMLGSLSAILGGLLGINQTLLRPLIAYSSVGHSGWLAILSCLSINATNVYFILYVLILWGLLWSFEETSQLNLSQSNSLEYSSSLSSLSANVGLLSLGGIPPLTGFFSKVWAIQTILSFQWTWILVILIMGSLINLSYYLTILFNLFISYSPLNYLTSNSSPLTTLLILNNFLGVSIITLVLLWS